jgi:type IV secretory pathway VirB3-like protein
VTALTLFAVAVHGYHPYAEDGGLYLPEIKRLLRPELYPYGAEFVVGHLRFSIFAPVMAGLVRWSHLQLETVLLLVHLVSFWTTLFAAWLLAARCYKSREARCGAVALLAVWITLPIAGTSLMLMDPYVTARSFSTPCTLLALVGALEFLRPRDGAGLSETQSAAQWRGLLLCCAALVGAVAMHPLMGAYGLGCVAVLGCAMSSSRKVRTWATIGLCCAALAVAGAVQMSGVPESTAYLSVVLTRYYWFLSEWHWFELMGLVAPLTILALVGFGRHTLGRDGEDAVRVGLTRMAVIAGVTATTVALLFAREGLATHSVARLQPLRIFQLVYVVMILVVGAALGERMLQRSAMRWLVAFSLLAGVMVFAERQTYPGSARVELPGTMPGSASENPWERAFVWVSRNTPQDARFALDSHYINLPGEDAQGFRAIAERSVLPDYSKDGGVVANKPALTGEWMQGVAAQTRLSTENDAARMEALRPLGVGWVVLDRGAATGFRCDYANAVVKVCRLP